MTVFTGQDLRQRLLDKKDLVVTPLLSIQEQLRENAIDVRLDNRFVVFARSRIGVLRPSELAAQPELIREYQRRVKVSFGEEFVLHPNELVVGSTLEYVSIPRDLMAYVIGRSSWGRLGLIIATATAVNAGFRGTITLELVNVSNVPICLNPGVRIAQLVFHSLSKQLKSVGERRYVDQYGPVFSRIGQDSELSRLVRPATKSQA